MLGLLYLLVVSTPTAFDLEVSREGATRSCPPGDVRARVVALLGRDPFVDAGADAVRFAVTTRSGPRWSAIIRTSGGGSPVGVRRLRVPAKTCAALDETVALAVALAIDPLGPVGSDTTGGGGAEVAAGPAVDTVHNASPPERGRTRDEAARAERLGLEPYRQSRPTRAGDLLGWQLGVLVTMGFAPEVAIGPELGLTWAPAPWSIGVGGRVHSSVSRAGALPTAVVVWAAYADVCLGRSVMVCAALEGGAYRADAGRGDLRPHLAPGLALKAQGSGAQVSLRLALPVWRQRWELGDEEVWRMPAWIVGLAVGVTGGDRISAGRIRDGAGTDAPMNP